MSYWDIRKRAKLLHLPEPTAPLERAGVFEGDTRLVRSHEWMRIYHAEKAMKETIREASEKGIRGVGQYAHEASQEGEAGGSEEDSCEGGEDA